MCNSGKSVNNKGNLGEQGGLLAPVEACSQVFGGVIG